MPEAFHTLVALRSRISSHGSGHLRRYRTFLRQYRRGFLRGAAEVPTMPTTEAASSANSALCATRSQRRDARLAARLSMTSVQSAHSALRPGLSAVWHVVSCSCSISRLRCKRSCNGPSSSSLRHIGSAVLLMKLGIRRRAMPRHECQTLRVPRSQVSI